MNTRKYSAGQGSIIKQLLYRAALILPVSISIGLLVALFLWLLDIVTATRWQHLWLIFLLPVVGVFIAWLYRRHGKNSEAGNNLIIDEIHEPGGGIPARMTPLILVTTLLTHLVGGSAGREGTAVQMGGSIAASFSKWFKLDHVHRSILLMCGIAAGFGAVFGTPVAAAIFALEVLTVVTIKYDALLPCLIAGIVADITCTFCGIKHTKYSLLFSNAPTHFFHIAFDLPLLFKVIVAGMAFGLAGYFFTQLSHLVQTKSRQYISQPLLIPVIGAALIIGISYLLGTFDYLGLGVTTPNSHGISIVNAFKAGDTGYFSWFWKLLLTAITLGMGFKGGEVTPLFFIGATLGNTLALLTGSPIDLFAGLGFIAVFAGATNTPLACTIMGIELFGSDNVIYYAVACFMAYWFSGQQGIYRSQRVGASKFQMIKFERWKL